ncbi:hypothetical protein AB0E00_36455 [Streptomyces sp. NPDC048110]|uniref:hypothetical protein n=1 Tax=Streptomyces sp. NPDC048110 TaxID=3155483 RepID=UPI00340AF50D
MGDESDSFEHDEAEVTEGRTAEEGGAMLLSHRQAWAAAAGFRAMAADAARAHEVARRAMEPLQHVVADLQRYQQVIQQAVEPAQHLVADSQRYQQMIRDSMPDLSGIMPQIDSGWFRGLADTLTTVHRAIERVFPGNWLGESLDYTEMVPVLEEGVPLAWVPSAPVIRRLLVATDGQARARVLEANTEEIVTACREALSAVTHPDLQQQTVLLGDCLTMIETNLSSGAQALAASVWDTVYRAVWRADPSLKTAGFFKYKDVAKKLPKVNLDDSTLLQFRQACVFAPFVRVCDDFYDSHPVPSAFNRHATTHATGAIQYSRANALTALMLAVSLVRELEQGNLAFTIRS